MGPWCEQMVLADRRYHSGIAVGVTAYRRRNAITCMTTDLPALTVEACRHNTVADCRINEALPPKRGFIPGKDGAMKTPPAHALKIVDR